jgi:hypothetical protein
MIKRIDRPEFLVVCSTVFLSAPGLAAIAPAAAISILSL